MDLSLLRHSVVTQLKSRSFLHISATRRKTHYDVLGVGKNATLHEIKVAYFEKSKQLHPDRNDGDTKDFMELKVAYDVLRRPADRKLYDFNLAQPKSHRSYGSDRARADYANVDWQQYWKQRYGGDDMQFRTMRERHEERKRSWKNLMRITAAACGFIVAYNMFLWYLIVKEEKRISKLIAKDEIARTYLRQRDMRGQKDDNLALDYFSRILHGDIEEKMRARDEERRATGEHNPLEIREEWRWLEAVKEPSAASYKKRGE
ncbi:unnamed protein product [Bursaphelenchus okinawaensis]|uniref:J domain-containing protein n=1 Tax=Bursaphelenchus okinawaensis TaxID=465554 RepID=A0A811JVM1_9BILA|nr:unnamed protein product [Bursaphelenchus okinawaensis]CAG9085067.1 unnamed protein product [Bursaphelenchus okinawaensis]